MEVSADDKLWGAIAHAAGCAAGPVGPGIIWFIKKDTSPFVAYHAIQSAVYWVVAWVAFMVLATCTLGFGAMLFPVLWLPSLYWGWQAYQGSTQGFPGIAGVGRPPELG